MLLTERAAAPEGAGVDTPGSPERFDPSSITRPDEALLRYYLITSIFALPVFPFVFLALYIRYSTLRYRLDDEGVQMAWGLLWRREINLTYRRIQDIHVTANFIERWMGLSKVQIQTASGNSAPEMRIEGVLRPERLRDFLYTKMRGAKGERVVSAQSGAASQATGDDEALALLREIRDALRAAKGPRE